MTASNPRQPSRVAEHGPTGKSSRRRPEEALQRQAASYIDMAYPELIWFHPPNGGGRSKAEAGALKAQGVKRGVPDIALYLPTGLGAFIEIKAPKGRLSPEQKVFRDKARAHGCLWEEARSLPEVAGILDGWLTPFGWRSRVRIAA